MANSKAVICIPDVTGFTNFINKIDIEYTQKIMPAILRSIVSSNILDFEVAEIQGDAVLFYKMGDPPSFQQIVKQCKNLYFTFQHNINFLDKVYGDKLGEFNMKKDLGLKIVIHYGEVGLATVVGNTKLYGQDVIIALELLKNNIPCKEYVLFSDNYLKSINYNLASSEADELIDGKDEYEKLGKITYKYFSLEGCVEPEK